MYSPTPTVSRTRRRRRAVTIGFALVVALVIAFLVQQSVVASGNLSGPSAHGVPFLPDANAELTADDGAIPDGRVASVFDDDLPTISKLNPGLLAALRQAATDAALDDITFQVTSGWRSPSYQQRLFDDAVRTYGAEEAPRWAATPKTSAHITGDAVDLGPFDATYWLSQNGAAYGLCQTYSNESWHFELRPEAVTDGCPEMYADASEDPRMRN